MTNADKYLSLKCNKTCEIRTHDRLNVGLIQQSHFFYSMRIRGLLEWEVCDVSLQKLQLNIPTAGQQDVLGGWD